jgi:hypothetical protein
VAAKTKITGLQWYWPSRLLLHTCRAVLGGRVSKEAIAFWAALIGAGVGAISSAITALLTARFTERRERRARLFDARRVVYVEALRGTSLGRFAITNPVLGDPGMGIEHVSRFMAELELLGSPDVYRAYGELSGLVFEALGIVEQVRSSWTDEPTEAEIQALRGSERMRQLVAALGPAETKLRDAMRKDLGEEAMGEAYLW